MTTIINFVSHILDISKLEIVYTKYFVTQFFISQHNAVTLYFQKKYRYLCLLRSKILYLVAAFTSLGKILLWIAVV